MMCSKDGMFKKTLINGEVRYDKEGPWCDLWSLGIVIQNMILGKENTMYKVGYTVSIVVLYLIFT